MSTNDIFVRRAAEASRVEELRRLEAEQAERERQRLGLAHHVISKLDQRFRELVTRRDEAARKLPDLSFQEPSWPDLSTSVCRNPVEVEKYAEKLQRLVNTFDRQLQTAVQEAETILADRLARAEAWRDANSLEQAVRVFHQNLSVALQAMQEPPSASHALDRPASDASLPSLQRYVAALQARVTVLQRQINSTHRRLDTRRFGQSISGRQMDANANAQTALSDHAARQRLKARQVLQDILIDALADMQLSMSELPVGTQILLNASLESDEANDLMLERIRRLVARERALHEQAAQAFFLIQAPPDLVHAQPELGKRWQILLQELQSVAAGMCPLSPQHRLEYDQIRTDAQRALDRRYVQTEFVNALREQGLNALSDADGRLIVEDLRNLGIWLEETQALEIDNSSERGGIAAVLELKTDAPLDESANDEQVIASVCERLQAASQSTTNVKGEYEVLDRKKRISRGRRPAILKSLSAQT